MTASMASTTPSGKGGTAMTEEVDDDAEFAAGLELLQPEAIEGELERGLRSAAGAMVVPRACTTRTEGLP